MKLTPEFYDRENVVQISKDLLGKFLFTSFKGQFTGGMITETEAYEGVIDKASHAYGNRRTNRTEIMYAKGGTAYVYLCYGIHSLFNVVTNNEGTPHAVLIRAIQPLYGIETILERRKQTKLIPNLTVGPGKVSEALGIHYSDTGKSLSGDEIWIEDKGIRVPEKDIIVGPRVGVDYAGDHALWPYRFILKPEYVKSLNLEISY